MPEVADPKLIAILQIIRTRLISQVDEKYWHLGDLTSAKLSLWTSESLSTIQAKQFLDKNKRFFRRGQREGARDRLNQFQGAPCFTYNVNRKEIDNVLSILAPVQEKLTKGETKEMH